MVRYSSMKRFLSPFLIATLVGGIFYLPLLPERITWQNQGADGGDFLAAILTQGVPHPSGYPLYLVIGAVFQSFPVHTPYWRGALLSALCMAMAAGLLALWVEKVVFKAKPWARAVGVFSAFLWLSTRLVWSQALIVEVHGLHALVVMIWVWWISALIKEILLSIKTLCLLSGMAGLGVGNHLSIVWLLPLVLWAGIGYGRRTSWRFVFLQAICFGSGLLIYGILPLRAQAYPPVNWGGASDWQGFLWLVTGKIYQGMLFNVDGEQFLSRLSAFADLWLKDFSVLGVLLALGGGLIAYPTRVGKILLWIFLAFASFSLGYVAEDSQVYLIPAWMALSMATGIGLMEIKNWKWKTFPVGWVLISLFLFWVLWRIPATLREVDVRYKGDAADFAEHTLQSLPLNAVIVTIRDQDTFPLWYYHFGLKQRPDVRIVVLPLTPFAWYRQSLQKAYPDLHYPSTDSGGEWGEKLLALNSDRAICQTKVDLHPSIIIAYECQGN